ncbi:MAG: hypothetical protein ACI9MR_000275 [Myxococcota bacterium]|jgi:hypothetical protein
MKFRVITTLLALALPSACAGSETGNPFDNGHEQDIGIVLTTRPGLAPEPTAKAAWLALGDLAFIPSDACDAPGDIPSALDGIVAIATEGVSSFAVTVTEGQYCGLRLGLAVGDTSGPMELLGRSLRVEGALPDGTAFAITSAVTTSLVLAATADDFELTAALPPVLLSLELKPLLSDTGLAAGVREADGSLLVDADHNADILAQVEGNLPAALVLFRDINGNGALDPEDEAEGIVAGP